MPPANKPAPTPAISVSHLDKTYGSGFKALNNVNLDIRHGEFVVDNGRRKESVNEAFAGSAQVCCEFQTAGADKIVVAKLRKLNASPRQ